MDSGVTVMQRGGPIPHLTAGEGPPLLLLHGCPGSMFSWRSNMASLAQGYRVFALDLNDLFLQSGTHSLDIYAQAVLRFMMNARIMNATVIGHSMGAGIGLHLAALAPGRVRSLALLGSVGVTPHLALRFASIPGVAQFVATLGPLMPRVLQGWFSRIFHSFLYNGVGPLHSLEAQREQVALVDPRVLFATLKTAGAANCSSLRAAAELVKVPTLIIHGSKDRLVPPSRAVELASALRMGEVLLLEGAGHMLHVERAEAINKLLRAFIGKEPQRPLRPVGSVGRGGVSRQSLFGRPFQWEG